MTDIEQQILGEIDKRQKEIDQLSKEFDAMGFFKGIFFGGKNLRQRRILLEQNAPLFDKLYRLDKPSKGIR